MHLSLIHICIEQSFQQLVLVFLYHHRPVLQSCKHIGIQYIIANIVHLSLIHIYRIILSADTASEVRQMLSQKRR